MTGAVDMFAVCGKLEVAELVICSGRSNNNSSSSSNKGEGVVAIVIAVAVT